MAKAVARKAGIGTSSTRTTARIASARATEALRGAPVEIGKIGK